MVEEMKSEKKNRKRKKSMYRTIVKQMEFYLGDANMSKSDFLRPYLEQWIPLDIFLTFNKLVGMLKEFFGRADSTEDLWKALKSIESEVFEVEETSESGRRIKRKRPLPIGDLSESKTIYVERLPPNVTLEMLQDLFGKHGEVAYVSLPKYKHNSMPKGFAFIEFKSEDGVKKSLESYVLAKRKISTAMDPAELQSIKSYQLEQEHLQGDKPKTASNSPPKKKAKLESDTQPEKEEKPATADEPEDSKE